MSDSAAATISAKRRYVAMTIRQTARLASLAFAVGDTGTADFYLHELMALVALPAGPVETLRHELACVAEMIASELNLKSPRDVDREIRRLADAGQLIETPLIMQWLAVAAALAELLDEIAERSS